MSSDESFSLSLGEEVAEMVEEGDAEGVTEEGVASLGYELTWDEQPEEPLRVYQPDLETEHRIPSSWDHELRFLDEEGALIEAVNQPQPGMDMDTTVGLEQVFYIMEMDEAPKLEELLCQDSLYPLGPPGSRKSELVSRIMNPSPDFPELLTTYLPESHASQEPAENQEQNRDDANEGQKEEGSGCLDVETRARERYGELGAEDAARLHAPLAAGWSREVVWRAANDGTADIYYYTPGRKRWFRGQKACMDYVERECAGLSRENFCFLPRVLDWPGPEDSSRMSSRFGLYKTKAPKPARPRAKEKKPKAKRKKTKETDLGPGTLKISDEEGPSSPMIENLSEQDQAELVEQLSSPVKPSKARPQRAVKSIASGRKRQNDELWGELEEACDNPTTLEESPKKESGKRVRKAPSKPVSVVKPQKARRAADTVPVPRLRRPASSPSTSLSLGKATGATGALAAVLARLPPAQRLAARLVSATWDLLAASPAAWTRVELRDVKVSDWPKALAFFKAKRVKHLDMEGVVCDKAKLDEVITQLHFCPSLDLGSVTVRQFRRFIAALPAKSPLTSLRAKLTGQRVCESETVEVSGEWLGRLRDLRGLRLSSPGASVFLTHTSALAHFPNLTSLVRHSSLGQRVTLWVEELRDVFGQFETGMGAVAALPCLRALRLGSCEDWTTNTYMSLRTIAGLRSLQLDFCHFHSVLYNTILHLNLIYLDLVSVSIDNTDFTVSSLPHPTLRHIDFRPELDVQADELELELGLAVGAAGMLGRLAPAFHFHLTQPTGTLQGKVNAEELDLSLERLMSGTRFKVVPSGT